MSTPFNKIHKWTMDVPVEKVQATVLKIIMDRCDRTAKKPSRIGKNIVYYPCKTTDPTKCDALYEYLTLTIKKVTNKRTCVELHLQGEKLTSPSSIVEELFGKPNVHWIEVGVGEILPPLPLSEGNWRWPWYEAMYYRIFPLLDQYSQSNNGILISK